MSDTRARSFILEGPLTSAWIASLIPDPGHLPDETFDCPSCPDMPLLGPDWHPALLGETTSVTVKVITRAAQELGVIAGPPGMRLEFEASDAEGTYQWQLTGERHGTLLLSTLPTPVAGGLAAASSRGRAALAALLKDAVDAGNHMLELLHGTAAVTLAETTDDPVLLTRLADNPDPVVRAAALDNPACPDEGRVLAALHRD